MIEMADHIVEMGPDREWPVEEFYLKAVIRNS